MAKLLLALLATCAAAWPGPRIFIVTDMEGVGGVNRMEQVTPGERRYEETRKLLAGEVNAAVRGAFAAGASEVVIWDGHDGSRSINIDAIDARARLIQGAPTPPTYYMDDGHFDGLMFVGQHAMAGSGGILAHTQSGSVKSLTLNGRRIGEIGQSVAIAGYYGTPVIFLSGDQTACEEVRELQPGVETVAVKRLAGKASSLSLSHAEATRLIEEHAALAVKNIAKYKPWKIEGPVEMRFEFLPVADFAKMKEPAPAVYRGATVLEAFQQWLGGR